jgi:para-aminobenzoate synthetase component I
MSVDCFIERVNEFAHLAKPFFFVVDFEQKKPLVYTLEEAAKNNVFFDIGGQKNFQQFPQTNKRFEIIPKTIIQDRYKRAFDQVQEHIKKGDSYLLNLTFPSEVFFKGTLKELFLASKAPYKLFFKNQFVSYSPECFVKIMGDEIFSYPMKGTVSAILPNAEELLLKNSKEIAEHATIVDLIRNDLSLYAKKVRVNRFRYLHRIVTQQEDLFQVSSEIQGELTNEWRANLGNIIWDMLPAGSVSGAPKTKTLEIIESVEESPRGYYTGVYGFFDGQNLESAVAIRFLEQYNGNYFYRSGGGVTAQSNYEEEYQELLDKIYVPTF